MSISEINANFQKFYIGTNIFHQPITLKDYHLLSVNCDFYLSDDLILKMVSKLYLIFFYRNYQACMIIVIIVTKSGIAKLKKPVFTGYLNLVKSNI